MDVFDYRNIFFFFVLIFLVFCDLIGCLFYFSFYLFGEWRRDGLLFNMQNVEKVKLVLCQSVLWNILNIRIIFYFNDKDFIQNKNSWKFNFLYDNDINGNGKQQ